MKSLIDLPGWLAYHLITHFTTSLSVVAVAGGVGADEWAAYGVTIQVQSDIRSVDQERCYACAAYGDIAGELVGAGGRDVVGEVGYAGLVDHCLRVGRCAQGSENEEQCDQILNHDKPFKSNNAVVGAGSGHL